MRAFGGGAIRDPYNWSRRIGDGAVAATGVAAAAGDGPRVGFRGSRGIEWNGGRVAKADVESERKGEARGAAAVRSGRD